jgi:lipopolysaccharide/colanic/teichoic acid biosynthesis glycosyltransferase
MASALTSFYARRGKRALDCVLSAGALLALSPVILAVAAAVRKQHGRPILLQQERTGLGGKPFRLMKFRSMTEERSAEGQLLPDHERLTKLGRFLRETSLDELPELVNVLRGEMSLVGPRPLLHHYMQYYSEQQHRRHLVRPGITGWAAVNGRNTTSWEERFELDLWYLDRVSLKTDLVILLRTLETIISRRDVNPKGEVTMPEFRGSANARGSTNGRATPKSQIVSG